MGVGVVVTGLGIAGVLIAVVLGTEVVEGEGLEYEGEEEKEEEGGLWAVVDGEDLATGEVTEGPSLYGKKE